ncbi:MAG: serine hydrolase [Cyclobacteriaceae bacterium]
MLHKLPSFLFLALVTLQSCTAQPKQDINKDAFNLIEKWMEAQSDYQHLPGISAAIVKDQETIWSKAYGKASDNVNASPATLYSICSISKLFTSVAIMQLYDAGKLRLDDEVKSVLPSFNIKQQYKNSGPITIRSLLTHSSGLPREADAPYWTGPDFPFPTKEEINSKLGGQETLYPASTYFQYSNLGMSLLGEVIEKISGMPYEEYVEKNILQPLRLASTHPYMSKEQWGKELAVGYGAIKRDGTRDKVELFDAKGITAAAGYSSNVEDLGRFASWQFRLLEKGGIELIKSSTLKEMQRVQWVDPDWGVHWGLGFVVSESDGTTMVSHGGSCPGYRTTLQMDPKNKMAYTVMINAGGESPEKFARGLRHIMDKVPKDKKEKKSGANLETYAGRYTSQPWGSETVVVPWYGDLAIMGLPTDEPDEAMTLLQHVSGDTFRRIRDDKTLGEEITFEKEGGKVIKMWRNNNFSMRID